MRLGTQVAISMSVDVLEDVECPPKNGTAGDWSWGEK